MYQDVFHAPDQVLSALCCHQRGWVQVVMCGHSILCTLTLPHPFSFKHP